MNLSYVLDWADWMEALDQLYREAVKWDEVADPMKTGATTLIKYGVPKSMVMKFRKFAAVERDFRLHTMVDLIRIIQFGMTIDYSEVEKHAEKKHSGQ